MWPIIPVLIPALCAEANSILHFSSASTPNHGRDDAQCFRVPSSRATRRGVIRLPPHAPASLILTPLSPPRHYSRITGPHGSSSPTVYPPCQRRNVLRPAPPTTERSPRIRLRCRRTHCPACVPPLPGTYFRGANPAGIVHARCRASITRRMQSSLQTWNTRNQSILRHPVPPLAVLRGINFVGLICIRM